MIGRNSRGNRRVGVRARLGIATAVLAGGAAVGVTAVAVGSHAPATATAQSAGFTLSFQHRISEQAALSSAIGTWASSQQRSLTTLAEMAPMRTFSQVWHGRTLLAAQRGVVVLATRKFLLVKSANRALHLWWLTGATAFKNVSGNPAGLTAMTGSTAAAQAMAKLNMAPAAAVMAGGATAVNQLAAPAAKPTTVTIDTGTQVITITITATTATVTEPGTSPAVVPGTTATATPATMAAPTVTPTVTSTAIPAATPVATATATPMPTATVTQPAFTATKGVARGDLVFVVGVREHGFLIAKLVLFAAPANVTPVPTVTPTVTATPTVTTTPVTPGATPTISGTHS